MAIPTVGSEGAGVKCCDARSAWEWVEDIAAEALGGDVDAGRYLGDTILHWLRALRADGLAAARRIE